MNFDKVSRRSVLQGTAALTLATALPVRPASAKDTTVGFIYVGSRDDYGYNQAHAQGAVALKKMADIKVVEEEKEELLDIVWGDRYVSESALTTRIKQARYAVGDDGRAQRVIKTVHGRGYRLVAAVDELVRHGGHLGYLSRRPWHGDRRWLDARLAGWLRSRWAADGSPHPE